MCAISVVVSAHPKFLNSIGAMNDSMQHRGPDAKGTFCAPGISLGHRRLSIIDTSNSADQPMFSSQTGSCIVFNGEIYNFKELALDLKKSGISISTKSDTEVLLKYLDKYQEHGVKNLNGMFAFAYFNPKTEKLIIARDRLGIKPLYFCQNEKGIAFSSEIRGIHASGLVKREIDDQAVTDYLLFQNILPPKSLYKNVYVVEPGTYYAAKVPDLLDNGTKLLPVKFWRPSFVEKTRSWADAKAELVYLLENAVNRQIVSDVPIGSYLSGGVDSGTIAALANRLIPRLQTFCVGFEATKSDSFFQDSVFDESSVALGISQSLGTLHHSLVVRPAMLLETIGDVSQILEEPRVGQSYPNFFAAKLASAHVKVVLSGTGGDELFGGYPWRYPTDDKENVIEFASRVWNRNFNFNSIADGRSPATRELYFQSMSNLREQVQSIVTDGAASSLDAMMIFEMKTFLAGLLMVEDKISMHFSIEGRVPLLDNVLIDFAMSLPASMRIHNGVGKVLLRDAMQTLSPKLLHGAKKQGFSAPDATWFSRDLKSKLESLFNSGPMLVHKFVKPETINECISNHSTGKENNRGKIWSLLTLESTLQRTSF